MEGPPPTCELLGAPTRSQTVLLAFPAQSPDKPLGLTPSFTKEPAETSPLRPFWEGMLLLPTLVGPREVGGGSSGGFFCVHWAMGTFLPPVSALVLEVSSLPTLPTGDCSPQVAGGVFRVQFPV